MSRLRLITERIISTWTTAILTLGLFAVSSEALSAEPTIDFNRDIRPILSAHCFLCHGPDENRREADLRFDQQENALADRDGYFVIKPGSAAESELVSRIESEDPDQRMPPSDAGQPLSADQIQKLKQWVEQGATWDRHWSFVPTDTRRRNSAAIRVFTNGDQPGRLFRPTTTTRD